MNTKEQRLTWWVLGSCVLMVVGAFGPWIKALGESVGGTDGSNDGWIVDGAALLGALLFYAARGSRSGAVWAFLAGIGGLAVTIYDRQHVQHEIDQGGAFLQGVASIGWGLNLALAASASLTVAAAVWEGHLRSRGTPLPAPASVPPPLPASPTPSPTPPPD